MGSQSLLSWFISPAGSGWTVVILMVIGLILKWLFRKKPKIVFCKEINTKSLTLFEEDEKRLKIYFDKKPIDKPFNLLLALYNKGTEVIEDIKLTFKFASKTKVIDASFEDIESEEKLNKKIIGNQIVLNIPFLNPIRPHNHMIRADILCDGDTDGYKITGSGEGWSLRTIRLPSKKQLETSIRRWRRAAWWALPASFIFGLFLRLIYIKLPPQFFSIASIILLIGAGAAFIFLITKGISSLLSLPR